MSSLDRFTSAIDRRILDAAVARVVNSPMRDQFLLRGSYLTSLWVGAQNRRCADLDFLAMGEFDDDRIQHQFREVLGSQLEDSIEFNTDELTCEIIFGDTEFPGCRLAVPASFNGNEYALQIDIGFGDPLSAPPIQESIKTKHGNVTVACVCPEIAFGWKLHGIVEREGLSWRPKDMADLWLIQNHFPLNPEKLYAAIKVAFESRDAPYWRLNRLFNESMGRTSGSRKRYAKFLLGNGRSVLPGELNTVISEVASVARPAVRKLCPEPACPFAPPLEFSIAEMREALGEELADRGSVYREYPWHEGFTYVQERVQLRISPHLAETKTKNRKVKLQREARGITFDRDGKIIARPYAAFEPRLGIDNIRSIGKLLTQDQFESCEVLEKLDGSLVFPAPDSSSNSGWRLRTRRGRSSIADDSFEFIRRSDQTNSTNYQSLIQNCVDLNLTPIFEWCSRKRIIVLDHPVDRLVLTGVRDNASGKLSPFAELRTLAEKFGVEPIRKLERPQTLQHLCEWVEQLKQAEGLILRSTCGRQFKIKSNRYLWLHRAIEGPNEGRACWYLWAVGAKGQLTHCAGLRGTDLSTFFSELEASIRRLENHALTLLRASQADSAGGRRRLAQSLENESNLTSKLAFGLFDGRSFENMIREEVAKRSQNSTSFSRMIDTLDKLNGGNDES